MIHVERRARCIHFESSSAEPAGRTILRAPSKYGPAFKVSACFVVSNGDDLARRSTSIYWIDVLKYLLIQSR